MRKEGLDQIGNIPSVLTETGVPFDLNQGKSYETGDYSDQVSALDAVHFGIEGSGIQGYTLWNYTAQNNHQWGDNWDGEDLSIVSVDDPLPTLSSSTSSLSTSSPSYSRASTSQEHETPSSLKKTLTTETMTHSTTLSPLQPNVNKPTVPARAQYRALAAHLRPWPRAVHGSIVSYGFSLATCTFTCSLSAKSATPTDHPTELFLPAWHFPPSSTSVTVSGGKWSIVSLGLESGEDDEDAAVQVLRWWHADGEQKIEVKGLARAAGITSHDGEEELGYLEQCRKMAWGGDCNVM
jgi:hypothetical protein